MSNSNNNDFNKRTEHKPAEADKGYPRKRFDNPRFSDSEDASIRRSAPWPAERDEKGKGERSEGASRGRGLGRGADKGAARVSLAEEISNLDKELVNLLAKRTYLVKKMRGGKAYSATGRSIQAEKEVRSNWEAQVSQISRDARFSRELFDLIQDLDAQELSEQPRAAYNLAPFRKAVDLNLHAPAQVHNAKLWLSLAAFTGKAMQIHGLQRSSNLVDFIKAYSQAGSSFNWQSSQDSQNPNAEQRQNSFASSWVDSLQITENPKPLLGDKSIFVGSDELTLYLLLFSQLNTVTRLRFAGEHALKKLNLAKLYSFLPNLGARLAYVIPGSKGLPVTLESSAMLPPVIDVPASFGFTESLALIVAALCWKKEVTINLQNLHSQTLKAILQECAGIFACFNACVNVQESKIVYNGSFGELIDSLPKELVTPAQNELSSYLFAIPALVGGSVSLTGHYVENQNTKLMFNFLEALHLEISPTADKISCKGEAFSSLDFAALQSLDINAELEPLFWVMAARHVLNNKGGLHLETFPNHYGVSLVRDFLSQCGVEVSQEDGSGVLDLRLATEDKGTSSASKSYGWTSPSSAWTLAFSLLAFWRANIKLLNPDSVSNILPGYWQMYNSLPKVDIQKLERVAVVEEVSSKRRIKTNSLADLDTPSSADRFEDKDNQDN